MALSVLALLSWGGAGGQSLTTPFPAAFRHTTANELSGVAHLRGALSKARQGHSIKVMQIGDSHVRGNYLPRAIEASLRKGIPQVEFAYYGINGAWASRFYEEDMLQRVADENPDLLIVSFGTNEAHGDVLNAAAYTRTLTTLTQRIRQLCPGVCFLFTTPPGSFVDRRTGKKRTVWRRGRRRTVYDTVKEPNTNTANVARCIVSFCEAQQMAVWDLYSIGGGARAAENWRDARLMNSDLIHFLASGYTLQGTLLGEAIFKAYASVAKLGSQTRMIHGSTPAQAIPYQSMKGF